MKRQANPTSERKLDWRRVVFWLLVALAVAGLFALIIQLDSFQDCVCNHQYDTLTNGHQKQEARFIIYLACYVRFFENHNALIIALTGVVIAFFTATLWWATDRLQRASIQQSADMQRSIIEAGRAATAMEEVAKHFSDNVASFRERSSQQMRAYVAVLIGNGSYQVRTQETKFGAMPILINTGLTPARQVRFRIAANILPVPLPNDFSFPLPEQWQGGPSLNSQRTFNMHAFVRDFVDDGEVIDIMRARQGRALYVWGEVAYKDIFGGDHRTEFSQIMMWYVLNGQDTIYGLFTVQHNDSD